MSVLTSSARIACIGTFAFAAASLQAQPAAPAPAQALSAATQSAAPDTVRVLLVANRETTLSSPVAGRLGTLGVSMGANFGKGQTLVTFDCEEPTARHDMAKAELAGAQETLDARVRMQGLGQASDLDVSIAAAAVSKARAQIQLHQAQMDQCRIAAPWGGRVAKVHVRSFMSVAAGQPLVDIVMSGPLRLKMNLPSRLVARIAKGHLLNVAIDETGQSYEARVVAVNARVDPVSQTVEIEAVMTQNHADLLPGMSGVVRLAAAR